MKWIAPHDYCKDYCPIQITINYAISINFLLFYFQIMCLYFCLFLFCIRYLSTLTIGGSSKFAGIIIYKSKRWLCLLILKCVGLSQIAMVLNILNLQIIYNCVICYFFFFYPFHLAIVLVIANTKIHTHHWGEIWRPRFELEILQKFCIWIEYNSSNPINNVLFQSQSNRLWI